MNSWAAADLKGHLSLVDGGRLAEQSGSCLKQTVKWTNGQPALGPLGYRAVERELKKQIVWVNERNRYRTDERKSLGGTNES